MLDVLFIAQKIALILGLNCNLELFGPLIMLHRIIKQNKIAFLFSRVDSKIH